MRAYAIRMVPRPGTVAETRPVATRLSGWYVQGRETSKTRSPFI
jgi:hypothetical protein